MVSGLQHNGTQRHIIDLSEDGALRIFDSWVQINDGRLAHIQPIQTVVSRPLLFLTLPESCALSLWQLRPWTMLLTVVPQSQWSPRRSSYGVLRTRPTDLQFVPVRDGRHRVCGPMRSQQRQVPCPLVVLQKLDWTLRRVFMHVSCMCRMWLKVTKMTRYPENTDRASL